jgi:hypothetical protein
MRKKVLSLLPWLSLAAACIYLLLIIAMNEVPKDDGDGLQHFSISKASWVDHHLFLDHWGKPLFTVFSSLFAQFGFQAFASFNVLVFLITIFVIFRLIQREKGPVIWMLFIPWVFISIPDYTYSIVSGLTEPFFGMLLTIMLYAAIRKKWWVFALVASFTPFARSEGMMVLSAAGAMLLLVKQWKALIWLFIGPVLSVIAGYLLLGQPFWYFENDPYPELSPYGSGSWTQYLVHYDAYFGILPLLLLPLSVFGMLIWRQHDKKQRTLIILFFTGIFLGIIVIHSYFWANGLRGSMGLTRIALQGLPAFLALCFIGIASVLREIHFVGLSLFGLLGLAGIYKELPELEVPTQENTYHEMIRRAVNYINHAPIRGKVYYMHPMVAYYNGIGTKDRHRYYEQRFIHLEDDVKHVFKPGDILFRDSKFGATEQGLSFEELQNYPHLVPVKHFYSSDFNLELTGESKSVIMYQVVDPKKLDSIKKPQRIEQAVQLTHKIHSKKEFYEIDTSVVIPTLLGSKLELEVNYSLTAQTDLYLVFDDGKGHYVSQALTTGDHVVKLPFVIGKTKGKLYIHNPNKGEYHMTIGVVKWQQYRDFGIQQL